MGVMVAQKEVQVDGVVRLTTDSSGRQLHYTEEGVKNFWRWFDGRGLDGKSRAGKDGAGIEGSDLGSRCASDENGQPRIFYHGTDTDISAFDTEHPGKWNRGLIGYSARRLPVAGRFAGFPRARPSA